MDPKPEPAAPKTSSSPEGSAPAPTETPQGRGRLKLVVIAGTLFLLGFLASWFLRHSGSEADPDHVSDAQEEVNLQVPRPPAEKVDPAPARDKPSLAQGDEWLREGRFAQALAVFQALVEGGKGRVPCPLQLRRALCEEGLGNWDKAQACYQAIASHGVAAEIWLGQLGQARVHLRRGQPDEARLLLNLMLLGNHALEQDSPLLAELHYLHALACAADLLPSQAADPLHDQVMVGHIFDGALPPSVDWLTCALPPSATKDFDKEEIIIEPTEAKADQVVIRALSPALDVQELIDRLAKAGQLSTVWSGAAKQAATHRTAALAVAQRPLRDVLAGLVEPLGLVCQIEKDLVKIEGLAEKSQKWRASYRQAEARRALQAAAGRFPEHVLAPGTFLALGNLEASAGLNIEALSWYLRLVRETPRSRLVLPAHYNAGILQQRLGNNADAAKSFFRVVDLAPAHELTSQAYLRLGRMTLEEGNAKQAAPYFKRAEAKAAEGRTRAVAALHLISAHLSNNDLAAARAALTAYRKWLQTPPFRSTAQFLGAYASFLADKSRSPVSREAKDLLTNLLQGSDENVLGRTGKLLAGMAYRDLGMWDQAIQTYQKALPETHGPMAEEMSYHLAEALAKSQKHQEAAALLTALVKAKSSWSSRAQFQLAHLAFQANRAQECLDSCKNLLYQPTPLEQSALLALMGQAYERLGNFTQAARCYAGQLPDE